MICFCQQIKFLNLVFDVVCLLALFVLVLSVNEGRFFVILLFCRVNMCQPPIHTEWCRCCRYRMGYGYELKKKIIAVFFDTIWICILLTQYNTLPCLPRLKNCLSNEYFCRWCCYLTTLPIHSNEQWVEWVELSRQSINMNIFTHNQLNFYHSIENKLKTLYAMILTINVPYPRCTDTQ